MTSGRRELVVVTGLSGSGKSTALHTFEDLGYYCVDNLPIGLLVALGQQLADAPDDGQYQRAAVGVDVRNISDLTQFPRLIKQLPANGIDARVLFLTADTGTLIKRFNESRRPHPLGSEDRTIADAIALEQERLTPLAEVATRLIDTTHSTIYELREQIRTLDDRDTATLTLVLQSFGFKYGAPMDADLVFDMRCLPNPNWHAELRDLTGLEPRIADFLQSHTVVEEMFESTRAYLSRWIPRYAEGSRSYLSIAIGCTGGRHRSVYMTQRLASSFRETPYPVIVRHRQLAESKANPPGV